jgi:hypothetical protein
MEKPQITERTQCAQSECQPFARTLEPTERGRAQNAEQDRQPVKAAD